MTALNPLVIFIIISTIFVICNYRSGDKLVYGSKFKQFGTLNTNGELNDYDEDDDELSFMEIVKKVYIILKTYIFPIISCLAGVLSILNYFRLYGIC